MKERMIRDGTPLLYILAPKYSGLLYEIYICSHRNIQDVESDIYVRKTEGFRTQGRMIRDEMPNHSSHKTI